MSLHKSLVSKSALKRHRNVLNRAERIKMLVEEGKWDDARSVFGLPKVRSIKAKKKGKAKEKAVEGEEAAATAEGAAAAAPAAAPPKQERARQERPKQERSKQERKK